METKKRRGPHAAWIWTSIAAIALLAVLALNAPITFAGVTGGTATVERPAQGATDAALADVAEVANRATVTVLNLREVTRFGGADGLAQAGTGSGYIIDDQGHVVTNSHVVEGGTAFEVQLIDGTIVEAELVGSDPYQDVAVLRLELDAGQALPGVLGFGDSDAMRAGDPVIALGSPFGEYTNTVSTGIVNAIGRSLNTGFGYLMPNLIQHDADIYPGNSGGPLVNLDGEVIGMNVAKAVDPTTGFPVDGGIGFAIESNTVAPLVDEIVATGKVARAYLGIRAEQTPGGAGVISVEQGGPAAEAGLEAGDVITAIDGDPITRTSPFINQLIFDHKPGERVTLSIERGGEEIELDVTLAERPAPLQ